jgi:DNA-binding NarL/FixJ family response regulator
VLAPKKRSHHRRRIKVLVVDDRQLQAEMFRLGLSADRGLDLVGIQTDIRDLHAEVGRLAPDVIVLEYGLLLQREGADIVRAVEAECSGVRTLVVTDARDDETLQTCIRAGAAGYITKHHPVADLEQSIRAVHAGNFLFPPDPTTKLLPRTQFLPTLQARAAACPPLSARELEVLQILAEGLNAEEAAVRLGITANTVCRHLARSMEKLGVPSKISVIIRAIRLGLIEAPG